MDNDVPMYEASAIPNLENADPNAWELQYAKLFENAKAPIRSSGASATYDLFARDLVTFNPFETKLVPTGIKILPPEGTYGACCNILKNLLLLFSRRLL